MKRLMYLSTSILCLSVSALIGFHLGAESVGAQAPEQIQGYRIIPDPQSSLGTLHYVMLSNGDVYVNRNINPYTPFDGAALLCRKLLDRFRARGHISHHVGKRKEQVQEGRLSFLMRSDNLVDH